MWTITPATCRIVPHRHPTRPTAGSFLHSAWPPCGSRVAPRNIRQTEEEFVLLRRWEVDRDRPERLGLTDISEVDRDMSDVSRLPGPMDHAWQWQRLGACRGMDSGVFFHPDGERNPSRSRRTARAKEVCHRCPVMDMCREFALQTREPFGVWGGLAEAERRIILERRGLSAVS
jgi:WhiB family transcriptional regulator, redox-sensing transcriptional regulator